MTSWFFVYIVCSHLPNIKFMTLSVIRIVFISKYIEMCHIEYENVIGIGFKWKIMMFYYLLDVPLSHFNFQLDFMLHKYGQTINEYCTLSQSISKPYPLTPKNRKTTWKWWKCAFKSSFVSSNNRIAKDPLWHVAIIMMCMFSVPNT